MGTHQLRHGRFSSMHYPSTHGLYRADPLSPLGPSLLPLNDGNGGAQLVGHSSSDSLCAAFGYGLSPSSSSSSALSPTLSAQLTADHHHHQFLLTQKNTQMLQEVASARNDRVRLENQVYELDQTIANMRKENLRLQRAKKDYDKQMERNTAAFEQERALWQEREQELLRSLKFATRPIIVQQPKDSTEDTLEEVLPPKIQQQIAENNAAQQRALRAEEKKNDELRGQLLRLNNDYVEHQRMAAAKERALREENSQLRELNQSLMSENESFQMLLHEKTLNGELMQNGILKMGSNNGSESPIPSNHNGSINLADELGRAFGSGADMGLGPDSDIQKTLEKLQEENSSLKEAVKALQVYINKILSRIMEHPHSQRILAADYSPSRAAVPESPVAVIKKNNNNGSSSLVNEYKSDRSSSESQEKQPSAPAQPAPPKADTGRARSRSLFSRWSLMPKPRPLLEQPVLEENTRPGSRPESVLSESTTLAFQEGHVLEDSPRTSSSSSQEFSVEAVPQRPTFEPAEYEQLTTFDQPYSRKQLQRHASLGAAAAAERHMRRQTVGYAPSSGSRHDRYGSESEAIAPMNRRALHVKARSGMATVEASSEEYSSSTTTINSDHSKLSEARIEEEEAESPAPTTAPPKLSISTSSAVTSGTSSGQSSPATAPVDGAGIWARARRRLSLLGSANPSNAPTADSLPDTTDSANAGRPLTEEPDAVEPSRAN
ncbi:hypothetical protein BGW42_004100 [Actinomortierella wolfii]|nr:hypothetical protein BGW42_004100 [Actinomortierella wolfii]